SRSSVAGSRRAAPAGQHFGRASAERSDLLGLPTVPYEQLRYVTCLDLGRSGAVFPRGWDRQGQKTGNEAKAVKRMINTKGIYPPIDGTAEALLASSNIDLAARVRELDGKPDD